jgi:hypothetical protein
MARLRLRRVHERVDARWVVSGGGVRSVSLCIYMYTNILVYITFQCTSVGSQFHPFG